MAHFYTASGELISQVPYKDASRGLREATLADARQLGLLPSVTTVLALLDKPGLDEWKLEQGIYSALSSYNVQWNHSTVTNIKQQARQQVDDAATFGSAVHAGIAAGLNAETYWPTDVRVRLVLDAFWSWWAQSGIKCGWSEQPFANMQMGIAGTADIVGTFNGKPLLADFKTQDGDDASALAFYDPDHPLQLAGYGLGLGLAPDTQRMSIVISRTKPGLVKCKIWPDNERYDAAFLSLLATWMFIKNYDPRQPSNIVEFRR